MAIQGIEGAQTSQGIQPREIPPIVEKIAKWGGWIGAGLCFGFWIHSGFVFAGIAFFLAHLAARRIVKAERGLGTSPSAEESQNFAADAACVGRGGAGRGRPQITVDTFQQSGTRARMTDEGSDSEDDFGATEGVQSAAKMVPGGPDQDDVDEMDE